MECLEETYIHMLHVCACTVQYKDMNICVCSCKCTLPCSVASIADLYNFFDGRGGRGGGGCSLLM